MTEEEGEVTEVEWADELYSHAGDLLYDSIWAPVLRGAEQGSGDRLRIRARARGFLNRITNGAEGNRSSLQSRLRLFAEDSHEHTGITSSNITEHDAQWKADKKKFDKCPKPKTGTIDHLAQTSGDTLCLICREKPRDVAFFRCGHIASCRTCSKKLDRCPICRQRILDKVELLRSGNEDPAMSSGDCIHCGKQRDGMHYPCGHVCYCSTCGGFANKCPICKAKVYRTLNVYWS